MRKIINSEVRRNTTNNNNTKINGKSVNKTIIICESFSNNIVDFVEDNILYKM